jgi:hypothetical protein
MHGVEAPILKLQSATGVKDKVPQYWIDILLEKARQMKADKPGRTLTRKKYWITKIKKFKATLSPQKTYIKYIS